MPPAKSERGSGCRSTPPTRQSAERAAADACSLRRTGRRSGRTPATADRAERCRIRRRLSPSALRAPRRHPSTRPSYGHSPAAPSHLGYRLRPVGPQSQGDAPARPASAVSYPHQPSTIPKRPGDRRHPGRGSDASLDATPEVASSRSASVSPSRSHASTEGPHSARSRLDGVIDDRRTLPASSRRSSRPSKRDSSAQAFGSSRGRIQLTRSDGGPLSRSYVEHQISRAGRGASAHIEALAGQSADVVGEADGEEADDEHEADDAGALHDAEGDGPAADLLDRGPEDVAAVER